MIINPKTIHMKRVDPHAVLPTRAHADDAGMDLYGLENATLEPQKGKILRTGIAMAIPTGFVGMVADRSSMAKKGIKSAGGIIDAGYRGEVHIVLWNLSTEPVELKAGDRIAQLIIFPVATPQIHEVTDLDETTRGTKGFGSTGK